MYMGYTKIQHNLVQYRTIQLNRQWLGLQNIAFTSYTK